MQLLICSEAGNADRRRGSVGCNRCQIAIGKPFLKLFAFSATPQAKIVLDIAGIPVRPTVVFSLSNRRSHLSIVSER